MSYIPFFGAVAAASTTSALVEVARAPADLSWIAPTISALTGLVSVFAAIWAKSADRRAAEAVTSSLLARESAMAAKEESTAAKAQAEATQKTVDGGLQQLIKKVEEGAAAKAVAVEKSNQAAISQAVDNAVAKEQARPQMSTAAPPVPMEVEVVKGAGIDKAMRVKQDPEELAAAVKTVLEEDEK